RIVPKLLSDIITAISRRREVTWALAACFCVSSMMLASPQKSTTTNRQPVAFVDVTKAADINFSSFSSPDKKYIVESMGGGVCLFDFDGDGRLDIYLVNSYTVEAALAKRPRPPAALYRNLGNGTFEEVAAKAGVADPGWA